MKPVPLVSGHARTGPAPALAAATAADPAPHGKTSGDVRGDAIADARRGGLLRVDHDMRIPSRLRKRLSLTFSQ